MHTVTGEDRGRKAWHVVLLVDDDETILHFITKTQGEERGKHTLSLSDYGEVLKSGWGDKVPKEVEQSVRELNFPLYMEDRSTG